MKNKIVYTIIVLFFMQINLYSQDKEVPPKSVYLSVYKFIQDNRSKIVPEDQTDSYINSRLRLENIERTPKGYQIYMIYLKGVGCLNILYSKSENRSYILNEGYSEKKISIITDYLYKNIHKNLNKDEIAWFADDIIYYYLSLGAYTYEASVLMDMKRIIPLKITLDELKSTYFWPKLKISTNGKNWNLEFVAYISDGSIKLYFVNGHILEDKYLRIDTITHKEIYPKKTIGITTM